MIDFIVDGNLSFNVAQIPSLRVLLESVSGRKLVMPSRHKITSTLDSKFNEVKAELKERLSQQEHLCITADVWSSRAQSYLGVTCHFINASYERESYLLAFKQLKEKQTYDILAKALNNIFADFGIKTSQITNIVTDGGSAFCKMFKKYGASIDVVVIQTENADIELVEDENPETLDEPEVNLIVNSENISDTNVNTNSEDDVIQEYMSDCNGEAFVNEIITFDIESSSVTVSDELDVDDDYQEYFEGNNPVPQTEIKLPPQRRCFSHLLNLFAKDFEKSLDGIAKSAFHKTFDALHSLWIIVRFKS